MDAAQAELECDLILQGATALEDKLQDGVPEILADLRSAGVKVWMLTGDKVGTAKNIASACNMLPHSADVLEITTETFPVLADLKAQQLTSLQRTLEEVRHEAELRAKERKWRAKIDRLRRVCGRALHVAPSEGKSALERELEAQTRELDALHPGLEHVRAALVKRKQEMVEVLGQDQEASEMCLVIDEKAIDYLGAVSTELLSAVGASSHSVVACRARKDQKAEMLNLIRKYQKASCCLAIGDGANDVEMIKAGHIGVGIIGKEGRQAVNNSDFAIVHSLDPTHQASSHP
jgi:phospholipid-translocating ATPase